MDYKCKWCSAMYWKEEISKSHCCSKGTIVLSPLSKYPENLKKLLLYDQNFRLFIRYYNSLHSFVQFNVKYANIKGIYNLKIQGQISYSMPTTLIPAENEKPICGQLYFYEDNTAIEERLKSNDKLVKDHLTLIASVMENNPITKKYKYLKQIYDINNLPNYKLYFLRKSGLQKHTYNKPLTSDCGVIIVSKHNSIPENFDVCVYPKSSENNKQIIYLSKLSFHIDPMLFPILFPGGNLGCSTGFDKKPNCTSKNNVYFTLNIYRRSPVYAAKLSRRNGNI